MSKGRLWKKTHIVRIILSISKHTIKLEALYHFMKRIYLATLLGILHFYSLAQTEFITTWKTDNPGVSGDNQITIPVFVSETYNYSVDWGDGSSDANITGSITHTYASPGTYQVAISGKFPPYIFWESGFEQFSW